MNTWRMFWRIVRYRSGIFLLNLLTWTAFLLAALIPGLLIQQIFNILSGSAPASVSIWSLIALFTVVCVGRLALSAGGVALDIIYTHSIAALFRRNMFEGLLRSTQTSSVQGSVGEKISRFRDDVRVATNFNATFPHGMGQLFLALTALSIMLSIDVLITCVVFVPLLIIMVVINRANFYVQKYRRASQEAIGSITGFLADLFGMIQAVRVASAEPALLAQFHRLNERRRHAAVRDRLLGTVINTFSSGTVDIGIGLMLLLMGSAMKSRTFTVGDFALFIEYMWWLTRLPVWLGDWFAQAKQTDVSIERMREILPGKSREILQAHHPIYLRGPFPVIPEVTRTAADRLEQLVVRGLTYRYPGSKRGIVDLNLRIRRGSFTVITGRIGAGKTTFLRVLQGLLPRDEGEIFWNGCRVEDVAQWFVPPHCAYTPQVPVLFSETLRENILMGLPDERVDLAGALHTAVLEPDVRELENGLDTLLGARGIKLSGGQVQRAAAARMFVRGAELLICDDLSSALDVETERQLWQRVIQQNVTCLVVSHRPAVLRHADHIIVLRDGVVVAEGALNTLRKTCEEVRQYLA